MHDKQALKELLNKIQTIKDSWQIYEIFEQERKKFNQELEALQKDKEELMASFNEASLQYHLLQKDIQELEQQKKQLHTKQQKSPPNPPQIDLSNLDFESFEQQYQSLKQQLKANPLKPITNPSPLQKVEVIYQNNKKLLAIPAKAYILHQELEAYQSQYQALQEWLKALDLELAKLDIEWRDLKCSCNLELSSFEQIQCAIEDTFKDIECLEENFNHLTTKK